MPVVAPYQLAGGLGQRPLDEDLLADVPEGVGDGAGGHGAPENVAEVFARVSGIEVTFL